MKQKEISQGGDMLGFAISMAALAAIMFGASGCSFQVEMGYHGQTGRDDRTQTQLMRGVSTKRDDDKY
jgi:hypothetical protein